MHDHQTERPPDQCRSPIVGVKALADQFGLSPTRIRTILRRKWGYHDRGGSWTWEEGSRELAEVRQYLAEHRARWRS